MIPFPDTCPLQKFISLRAIKQAHLTRKGNFKKFIWFSFNQIQDSWRIELRQIS